MGGSVGRSPPRRPDGRPEYKRPVQPTSKRPAVAARDPFRRTSTFCARVVWRRCTHKRGLRVTPVPADLRAGPKRCRLDPEFGELQVSRPVRAGTRFPDTEQLSARSGGAGPFVPEEQCRARCSGRSRLARVARCTGPAAGVRGACFAQMQQRRRDGCRSINPPVIRWPEQKHANGRGTCPKFCVEPKPGKEHRASREAEVCVRLWPDANFDPRGPGTRQPLVSSANDRPRRRPG
jgi:hypothetical protein